MKFKAGDICVSDPSSRIDCYLIVGIHPSRTQIQYDVWSLKNNTEYYVNEADLTKIGEVSPELGVAGVEAILHRKPTLPADDSLEVLVKRARARKEAELGHPAHRPIWAFLAKAKPGDQLQTRTRAGLESIVFHHVLERGEKYVYLAHDENGKVLRYALHSLVLPT